MKGIIYIILLLAPALANANPVLNNLDIIKFMADLSEACRSEIRIKNEVRIYAKEKPLNLIRMRENYKKYQENMKFIKQVN